MDEKLHWFVREVVPQKVSDATMCAWLRLTANGIVATFRREGFDVSKARWEILEDVANLHPGVRLTWLFAYAPQMEG